MRSPTSAEFPGEAGQPQGTVLALVGPTAGGKTAVAGIIARQLPCEIVSADSRQVFREMTIGTAKPGPGDMRAVPHHFVDLLPPDEDYNAGRFGTEGRAVIGEILGRGNIPLVVGGSGLYVRSLLDGLFDGPAADDAVRSMLEERLRSGGARDLLEELARVDPDAAAGMLPSNTRRIIRALEVHMLTGRPISALQGERIRIPFRTVMTGLTWPRELLYGRINDRVISMVNEGLVGEVQSLLARGYSPGLRSLRSVGYAEVMAHLEGALSYTDMISLIQMNTRRFAKRQMTWFRKDGRVRWFQVSGEEEFPGIAREIVRLYQGAVASEGPGNG